MPQSPQRARRARRAPTASHRTSESRLAIAVVAATVIGLLAVALVGGDRGSTSTDRAQVSALAPAGNAVAAPAGDAAAVGDDATPADAGTDDVIGTTDTGAADTGADDAELGDLVEPDPADLAAVGDLSECTLTGQSVRMGDSGSDVSCLQHALAEAGAYSGAVSGEFDQATFRAVSAVQTERNLFVDGVVGRETALSLDIWPDEESFVVRTPPPPPGAVDLLGYPLSSVATSGPDAPPLPDGSGTGKRLVYERQGQRVWAVDGDERVVRSWLVTGSMYNNELPGTHYVYSRSIESTAWNGAAKLPKMVRWLQTERGHIGFHGIPTKVSDGSPYQTDAELGQRLSGGCQRQADLDADFVWEFAPEGTKVVVI